MIVKLHWRFLWIRQSNTTNFSCCFDVFYLWFERFIVFLLHFWSMLPPAWKAYV